MQANPLSLAIQPLQGRRPVLQQRHHRVALATTLRLTHHHQVAVVDVILDHYPVKSVLKISISPGWFSIGPWGKKLITIGGEDISLNDIEHRILRPIWRDPRAHYALNCTALSCPNLLTEAFTGANTGGMLDVAAWDYINRDGVITTDDDGLVVSSIFEWYKADFGGDDASLITHLMLYADGELAAKLEGVSEIVDHRYNWALNDVKDDQ